MEEFIYSIKDVFSDKVHGVLGANEVSSYYIAPYQRGYKWGSENRYAQVPRMLLDIYQAYSKKDKVNEYYLQYITVMKTNLDGLKVLEVIDGQQRLTTLSLFFYTLEKSFKGNVNITEDKLIYSRYGERKIFDEIISFTFKNIDDIDSFKSVKTQDEFYMDMACRCIYAFLKDLNEYGKLEGYVDYILNNVKLIINLESEFVKAEDVFCNLNNNKVPLNNAELIKGLLLTLGVKIEEYTKYKEIMDQRAIMGRMWDEINAWISQKNVEWYFFRMSDKGMENMLSLAYNVYFKMCNTSETGNDGTMVSNDECLSSFYKFFNENKENDSSSTETQYLLFEKFNEVVVSSDIASAFISNLKYVYRTLRGIYEAKDTLLYNLLGYYFFAERKNEINHIEKLSELLCMNLNDRLSFLKEKVLKLIPDMSMGLDKFRYKSHNPNLKNLLLSFSVFPEIESFGYKFNFYRYDKEKWSFEHIFPQHPGSAIKITSEKGINLVIKEVTSYYDDRISKEDDKNEKDRYENIKNQLIEKLNTKSKIQISEGLEFLYDTDIDIHCCGNMALIPGGTNAALSNNPFITKRPILMDKIIQGDFVPIHTENVFFKNMISVNHPFNMDISKWDSDDVNAHIEWMEMRNKDIINNLSK